MKYPRVVIHTGDACSACTSTLMLFLEQYHNQLADYALADGKTHLAIGKQSQPLPEGTITLGNCAVAAAGKGPGSRDILVRGCPPVCSQVLAALGISPKARR